jgi:hypothetical protein
MPGFVVQALSMAAFAALALILLAKSVGPRVVLGAVSLVSPAAARVVEHLLALVRARGRTDEHARAARSRERVPVLARLALSCAQNLATQHASRHLA